MSDGWETKKLGEVINLEYGKPLPRPKRKPDGAYPVYGANGEKSRSDEYYFDKPSIIVGRKGTAGAVNLSEEKFWPLDVTYFVTFENKKYDLIFLYYLLGHLDLPKLAKGVKPGINRNDIYAIEVPIPPIEEQRRIVALLDEALAGVQQATANTERNLANTQELFDAHLQAIFANPAADWEEKTLGETCLKIQDGAHRSPQKQYSQMADGRFLYITSKNIRNDYLDLSKIAYVDKEFHDSIFPRCNPELGDVLLTKDGSNTGNVTINTLNEPFSLLSSVCLIKTDREILLPKFLKFYLQSSSGLSQITGQMTGAAIKRIILKTIKAACIPLPPLDNQHAIVAQLDDLAAETQRLQAIYSQKLAALQELKQSILQQAFSGKLKTSEVFKTSEV